MNPADRFAIARPDLFPPDEPDRDPGWLPRLVAAAQTTTPALPAGVAVETTPG